MLSIGKLGQGQESYYLESVAQGIEDYYTGAGEAPGRWVGSATRGLGAEGAVDDDGLHAALGGSNPRTGDPLVASRSGHRVPGFDLTFSAPKSVSVAFGLADRRTSAEVRDAHEAAVDAAFDYMERHAAVTRRGRGGVEIVSGNGFVGAAFRHRTSRAGDPQLHTHVLVANMTQGPDGRWTALDARRLYAHAKTAGYLYQAQLRVELVRRLGVEWTPVRNGTAEIAGIPPPVLRAFSRRRAEIERAMDRRGEHSAKAAQVTTLDSRQAKDYRVTPEALHERWTERASRLDFQREDLVSLTGHAEEHALTEAHVDAGVIELASEHGLTHNRSSFTRRDVIQAWCDRLPQGADVAVAESLADEFLDSEHSVPLATDVRRLTHSDVIRRADGRVIAATAEERRHSTPELLAIEKRLIERALDRQAEGAAVIPDATVDAAIRRRPTLSGEQTEMVRRLTRDGHGVQIVTGKAGTGKTFALDAAREAWESDGHRVIGAAVARRAARELEDGAGIESTSLAALLQELRAGDVDRGLPEHAVVVVDEASMAGTRDLEELAAFAEQVQAKVVLVGDPHQLPEIEAGGAFRALISRTDPIELKENRRQREVWERKALDELREGKPEEAIGIYEQHGRVVLGDGAEDVRQRLVADWWEASGDGEATMIAVRRSDVADLNGRARALMRASGHLGSDELWIGDREFARGDHVVTLKNAGHLGVVNGTRGVVTAVDGERRELAVRTTDGRDVVLTRAYLESRTENGGRTLDHGYAITGHKAQGMTTDRAFVLGSDDLYREWGYVAMSRGSEENRLYVVAPRERDRDEYAPEEKRRDPLDALVASLEYSQAQTAALDVAAREGIGQMTTRDLVAERTRLAEQLADAVPERASGELDRLRAQLAEAERSAVEARRRVGESEGDVSGRTRGRRRPDAARLAADQALDAHARERVAQLEAREERLRRASSAPAREDLVRYRAVTDELDRRRRVQVRAAVIQRPEYLVRDLGAYPERRGERRAWRCAAARIETYRHEFGIEDQRRALGPEPRDVRQRSAWREARREVERAQRELAPLLRRERGRGREQL